jgi:hypothetical protein
LAPFHAFMGEEGTAMGKTWTMAALAAVAVASWPLTAEAGPLNGEDVGTIVIHVADFQRVPAADMSRAQRVAGETYARIGVRVMWVTGNETSVADGAVHLDVVILNDAMTMLKAASPTVLGQAGYETRRAYIFYPRVLSQARRSKSDLSRALAYVLAHEIGHMLLPGHGHVSAGLMQPVCDDRRLVNVPDFLPTQAQAVRARVLNRN